jgi:hypothetical protein
MSSRTGFLSRLIGLYCILIALSMVSHKQLTVDTITAVVNSPGLLFLAGLMAVPAGLALILSHNIWSGGAAPVLVTLTGWSALVKGLLFLFLTPAAESEWLLRGLQYERFFYLYVSISLVLGGYLTYAGSRSRS